MNIDIIDDNNEKTRPIYSKNIMNKFPSGKTEESSVYSIISLSYRIQYAEL